MKSRSRTIEQRQRLRRLEQGRDRVRRYRARQANPKYAVAAVIKGKGRPVTDPIREYVPLLRDSTILKLAARMKIAQPDKKFGRSWIRFMSAILSRAIEDLADGI
jgi:hypothetical protein